MPSSYRGITVPDDTDWADIETAFRSFLDKLSPVGEVRMFAGAAAPAGFLLCDGAAIPAGTDYNALRTLIGANTPDFRGRSPFGPGASGVALNAAGGAQTVALSEAQIGSHAHAGGTAAAGNHWHYIQSIAGVGTGNNSWGMGTFTISGQRDYNTDWAAQGDHAHNFSTDYRGGNQAHENMPPWRGINFIIKW